MTGISLINHILTNDETVHNLINGRVYPNRIPAQTKKYPMVVIQTRRTTEEGVSMAGPGHIYNQIIEVICLGREISTQAGFDMAAEVANAVEAALVSDTNIGLTVSSLVVAGIYLENESDEAEGLVDVGESFEVFQKIVPINIWFKYVPPSMSYDSLSERSYNSMNEDSYNNLT